MVRRNNRRTRASNSSLVRRVTNLERPRQVRGRADPPSYVQLPWWQCVISDTITLNSTSNSKHYTAKDIFNIWKQQVCPNSAVVIEGKFFSFRITRIDVWETVGRDIGLQVCDFGYALGSGDFLFQAVDAPGRNRWAHLSYLPPRSQQNLVMSGNDTENVFFVESSASSPSFLVRVHIMWKFRLETAPNRSLRQMMVRLQLDDAAAN